MLLSCYKREEQVTSQYNVPTNIFLELNLHLIYLFFQRGHMKTDANQFTRLILVRHLLECILKLLTLTLISIKRT